MNQLRWKHPVATIHAFCHAQYQLLMQCPHLPSWIIICARKHRMDNIITKKIGVIGYGNFGKVVCTYLFPQNKVLLYTKTQQKLLSEHVSQTESLEQLI